MLLEGIQVLSHRALKEERGLRNDGDGSSESREAELGSAYSVDGD